MVRQQDSILNQERGSDSTTPSYSPTPEESNRLDLVNERFNLAHLNQYPYFTDFDRYYKMYESYVNETKEIWNTKIFIPIVFSVIERFLPRIISNKPTVNYMPRNDEGDKDPITGKPRDLIQAAQNMQSLFDWQWEQVGRLKDGGMYVELLRFVKDALITGTAVAKIPWIKETRQVKGYNSKGEVQVNNVKYFDGPSFEQIDPYDFYYDPEALDVQRASWVIHRTRKTLDEMRAINASKGVEIYKNLDVVESLTQDNLAASENDFKYRRKVALGNGQVLVWDRTTGKYEVMECWGLFPKLDKNGKPTDDQELEPRVVTTVGRSVVVRDVPYPYWHGKKPFVAYTPFPRNFEFYGIPLIKHIERIQFYMNEFVAQKFDNQVLELNQMIVVDPAANVDDWQLVWRPGGVIRAHPEYIKPLPVGDVTSGIDDSLNYLNQVVQTTTGLSDYYTGGTNADQTENKTATGANLIEEQIQARVQEAVQVLEEQVIKEIGYQWHGLDAQFIKLPLVVRIIGDSGKPEFPLIMPEDARNEFDVMVEAGTTQPVNQALQRNQWVSLIQLIQGNPIMAQNTDWAAVEKELFRRFGEKNGDKYTVQTPGSVPSQMPGGDQMGAQGAPNPQQGQLPPQTNQMMLQNGMSPNPQNGNPQGNQPGQPKDGAKPPSGTVSVKLADLTLKEQEQWLQNALGINPDSASRLENFAKMQDQQSVDRSMDMVDRFSKHNPIVPQLMQNQPTK